MLPPLFPQIALAVSPIVPVWAGAPETERWLAEGQKPGVGARKGAPGIRSLGGCILCVLFQVNVTGNRTPPPENTPLRSNECRHAHSVEN